MKKIKIELNAIYEDRGLGTRHQGTSITVDNCLLSTEEDSFNIVRCIFEHLGYDLDLTYKVNGEKCFSNED